MNMVECVGMGSRSNIRILHWFTGNENQLRQAIELRCHFSVNSYSRSEHVILKIPKEKIPVEIDVLFIKAINRYQEIYEESFVELMIKLNF